WVNLTTNEKMVSYPKAWSTPRNFVKLTSLGSFGITSPASGTVKAMPPEIIWTSSDFATSYTIKFTDTTNSSVVLSQDIDSAGFLARRWTIPLGDWKDKFVIDRNYNIQVIAKRNTLTRNNGSGQQTLIKKELLLECKKYIDLPTLLNNEKSGSCETDLSYNHKPLFNWYSQSSPTSILGQMPPEITPIEVKWVKGATTYTHILSSDDIANGKYTPPTDMWRSLEAGLDWTVTMYAKWNGQVVIQSNPYTIRVPIENPDLVSPISKIYYSKPADTEFMWTDSRTDQTYQIYFYKDGSTTQSFILSTTVNGQTYLPWTTSAWDAVPNGNYKIKVKRTNDPVIYMSDEGSFTKAQLTAPVFSSTVPNGSMFFQTAPANNTYKWNSVTNASDYIVQLKKGDSSFSSNNVS
ncbi:hypothetical protein COY43_00210, partial [Candidatus Berkelbacteria bacterium CG_4_10_14_0_8_um_filter_35_9_33_8]